MMNEAPGNERPGSGTSHKTDELFLWALRERTVRRSRGVRETRAINRRAKLT